MFACRLLDFSMSKVNGAWCRFLYHTNTYATKCHSDRQLQPQLDDQDLGQCFHRRRHYHVCKSAIHLKCLHTTAKTMSRKKTKKGTLDADSEDESDEEEFTMDKDGRDFEIELYSDQQEDDPTVPATFSHLTVNTTRADTIICKALRMSHDETETLFYRSRFLHRGKTLLKKSKQLDEGDHIDIIKDDVGNKLLVQRVKVLKYLKQTTRKGKPVTLLRVWRKPFERQKI